VGGQIVADKLVRLCSGLLNIAFDVGDVGLFILGIPLLLLFALAGTTSSAATPYGFIPPGELALILNFATSGALVHCHLKAPLKTKEAVSII
jgi:hypothetical protein